MTKKYILIDHTADFGIHVFGQNPKELFANAAKALFDIITEIEQVKGVNHFNMHIGGDDWSDLMVNWLREILYLWNGKEFLINPVRIISISENELLATVYYDCFDLNQHYIKTEIKAVTYHQIQVYKKLSGWEAKIIFDV